MTKWFFLFISFFSMGHVALASYANYNSVLIGDQAAGMGGAYTALVGDPAGSSFYNPATLARMDGATLSAAINLYNKYDTEFGNEGNFSEAPLRVNQGSFVPIPASSGTVYSFGNFAVGLNIVFPDFDIYTGEIQSSEDASGSSTSTMNLRDESLWVGGSLALNLTTKDAVGMTFYYTSRRFSRSVTDQQTIAGITSIVNEEKIFTNNSIVYILGYYRDLSDQWSLGLSYRLPSIDISGRGSFFRSELSTGGGPIQTVNFTDLNSETEIPTKLSLGVSYRPNKKWIMSFDVNYYDGFRYNDLSLDSASDINSHNVTWNYQIGAEYKVRSWLAWRMGAFTNFSSQPKIKDGASSRQGDHIDMWGFSTNFAFFTSEQSSVTLGGYYTGGKGHSTQQIDQQIQKIQKSLQIFSFLVGTSFQL